MSSSTTDGALQRTLTKLHASLDRGEFYEAHQLCRTLCARYMGQKKYSQSLELAYDGALNLMDKKQLESGTDLALLFVNTLRESRTPLTANLLSKIEQLFAKIPSGLGGAAADAPPTAARDRNLLKRSAEGENRNKFLNTSIQWSKSVAATTAHKKYGHPQLHMKIASVYWQERNYIPARHHMFLGDSGEMCAEFLVQFHTERGCASEVDLFVAQAVFQFLSRSKTRMANDCFHEYTQRHPDIAEKEPPFVLPLLNFLWLLLLAVELPKAKVEYYSVLVDKYQPSLNRDPSYRQYLDQIGQIFFEMPAPRRAAASGGGGGGFLQSLIRGFMDDEHEEMEEEDAEVAEGDAENFHSAPGTPEKSVRSVKAEPSVQNGSVRSGVVCGDDELD